MGNPKQYCIHENLKVYNISEEMITCWKKWKAHVDKMTEKSGVIQHGIIHMK
jgi:hypothetical protein